MTEWWEIASGVFVRRYAELDLTVGLVLGDEQALVIDTRGDRTQGAELAISVRELTERPWQVAITHAHFDHCFGTGAFLPAPVWATRRCTEWLARTAAQQRTEWAQHYREEGKLDVAKALAGTEPALPDHHINTDIEVGTELDLGGRSVRLSHLGRGHTDHDLVVAIADMSVIFVGDLVENGAPPSFEDSYPAEWVSTMDELLAMQHTTIVPGHGDPVDLGFVQAQRDELATIVELCRDLRADAITRQEALARSPYPAQTTLTALSRP